MKLAEYQRAIVELGFAVDEPRDAALAPFALYRQMIRARLFAMAEVAYRRSWALLGEPACAASFARFLAREPPSSPLIREVIGAFAAFAEAELGGRAEPGPHALGGALLAGAPPEARSLLRFEAAKWRVASAEARLAGQVTLREVDFDGVLVLNPSLERLALDYPVYEALDASLVPGPTARRDERAGRDPHTLLIYRRRDDDDVRWYRAPALLAELLELSSAAAAAQQPLGGLVAALFARRAPGPGEVESLLEELAAALTVAVERDVLWGVREPVPA
jgi:hypothetical protein